MLTGELGKRTLGGIGRARSGVELDLKMPDKFERLRIGLAAWPRGSGRSRHIFSGVVGGSAGGLNKITHNLGSLAATVSFDKDYRSVY